MSARVFLTDSFRDDLALDSLCEQLGAALFDVWLGGDVEEVRPDLILLTRKDDPSALAHLDAPMVFLSDAWIGGADDVVHPQDFDLLWASLRSLHRRNHVERLLDHYAGMAQHKRVSKKASKISLTAGRIQVYADSRDFASLSAAIGDLHQVHRDEPEDAELIIVKDDLDVFAQISARPDGDIPVMFWSQDRAKIIKALDADAAGYILDLSSSAARITRQIKNRRRRTVLAGHFGATLDMALKDELTGLYNRRCLSARLPETIKEVMSQNKKRLAVVLLDIDRFKKVNDDWGHSAGDMILQRVSRVLRDTLRTTDEVYRIGGEEFLAVLPDLGMEESYAIARRLCEVISGTNFIIGDRIVPVTISAGVGLFQPGERVQTLMKRADEALYRAKSLGRNQAA